MSTKGPPRRLDAYLARAGLGTRSEVRRIIRKGRVTVDGEVCKDAAAKVEGRAVRLDGDPIELATVEHVLLHKPTGYSCSHNPNESPIVDELLPPQWLNLGLQTVGRLDRDTSGLLILTTRGDVLHRLTHPKHRISKHYSIQYTGELASNAVAQCARGILLEGDDRPTQPSVLTLLEAGRATLEVTEGRYHLVRRMIAALGGEVTGLHRFRVGDLELDSTLEPGQLRELTPQELSQASGGGLP